MTKLILESLTTIESTGRINGVALVPRVSLNGNFYTPEVMEMNDGVCASIDWNHDARENAGNVCFTYDKESQQLLYDGVVTDPEILEQIRKNPQMHVSIEGDVADYKEVCGTKACYQMPLEMKIVRMAITPTPGIPNTTLNLIESAPKKIIERFAQHKCNKEGIGDIVKDVVSKQISELEERIKLQYELFLLYQKIVDANPDDMFAIDQRDFILMDLQWMVRDYINLKKDSKGFSETMEPIIKEVGKTKEIKLEGLIKKTKERFCSNCGELKLK